MGRDGRGSITHHESVLHPWSRATKPVRASRGREYVGRARSSRSVTCNLIHHQRTRRDIATMKATTLQIATLISMLALTFARAADITPAEARAIAKEAYIYGYPLVDNYRVEHAYFVD